MKNYIVTLTSMGYKLLSLILCMALSSLTIILFVFHSEIPWIAICFSVLVTLFCLFACFLCFNHKIIIIAKQKLLIIRNIKTLVLKLEDIYEIKIDTKNSLNAQKYCFIVIFMKNGQTHKISEYSTLIKKNTVKITERKIIDLNEKIKIILTAIE